MPEPTPEAWAQIRHAYEHTDKPLAHICDEYDVSIPTVRYRMKRWDWRRRKPFVPREQPAAAQELTPFTPPRSQDARDPPPPGEGEESKQARPRWEGEENVDIVPRLQSAVARVLPAIDATIARLASGTLSSDGLEKAGRALGALTRTLRELNGLLAQHNAQPGGVCPYCDGLPDGFDNIDDFRRELARRIDAFMLSRPDEDFAEPGSGLPLEALK
jgi:hypothetical protein